MVGGVDDHGGRSGGAVWVDDADIDPGWGAPDFAEPAAPGPVTDQAEATDQSEATDPAAEEPERRGRRRRSRWVTVGVPVLVLALLISIVAVAGGFRARTDRAITVAPGTTLMTGPFELTFTEATIQEVNSYGDYERAQKVVVKGMAKNTWTESLLPDERQFAAAGGDRAEVKDADYVQLENSVDRWNVLTPGLPAQPIQVEIEFSPTFDPKGKVLFLVSDLTYGDHSALQSGNEEAWDNDGDRYLMHFPVKRLPAEEEY